MTLFPVGWVIIRGLAWEEGVRVGLICIIGFFSPPGAGVLCILRVDS